MKRKYAALVLGLTISMTAMNVCSVLASDTEESTETTEADSDTEEEDTEEEDLEEDEEEDAEIVEDVVGQVTAVGEDSLTIATGELMEYLYVDDEEDTDTEEDSGETYYAEDVLELDGEETTYTFDDTSFFMKQTDESMLIEVVEYSGEEDTDSAEEETEEDTEDVETEDESLEDEDLEEDFEEEEIELEEIEDLEEDEDLESDEDITIEFIELADIQVGDLVEVLVDSNGEITVILIQQADGGDTDEIETDETDAEETTASETEE